MPDNSQTDVTSQILSAALDGSKVKLVWSDSIHQELHSKCLRHSPGFPGGERPAGAEGRFPSSCEGLVPERAELTADGDLQLRWQPGGLQSQHSNEWLRAQLDLLQARGQHPPGQIIWDATRIEDLPKPAYPAVMADEEARLKLFEQVLNWGVTLIREVPAQPGTVETVAGWFGQIQPNPYADDPARPLLSSIRVDPAQPVATRMSHFLGPHTDTCWRQSLIGLLLMHCLQAHPEGGRSMLVDGFAVAARLREQSPEAFASLSTVPIAFGSVVADRDDWRASGRVISVSADKVIEGIRYNGNSIGQLDLPDDLVEPVYAALENFESILYDRSLWWRPLLAPGDLLVIDNHRVLHGREAFDAAAGERHIQCCNVERDDFHNHYRRLAKRLGVDDWGKRLSAGVI
jgi:gamma-butyrobetaine dioxygenase